MALIESNRINSKQENRSINNSSDGRGFTIEDLNYDLPQELIAQEPLSVRHESRLLVVNKEVGSLEHSQFSNIFDYLDDGDLLVLNDTKVIPARIVAKRKSGGQIRIQLIKPVKAKTTLWEALAMPMKRIKKGEILEVCANGSAAREAEVADVIVDSEGYKRLIVNLVSNENMRAILQEAGHAPLPPYIKRQYSADGEEPLEHREKDLARYQTVYASAPGAVAAPTAGLHFSNQLFEKLQAKNVNIAKITLHVGAGTFKPITGTIDEHSIEEERYTISDEAAELINETKKKGKRVIAVGTTSLRAIESAAGAGEMRPCSDMTTSLYIKPGYRFKIADAMVTNFHLSGSSLLVLVATFAGKENILKAYREAVEKKYRFYSYGDAMLIL